MKYPCTYVPGYTLMLLLLILLPACQSDLPEEAVPTLHANLFVRYIYPEQEYKAEAVFKEGDTLSTAQPVPAPGKVEFMGRVLPANQLGNNLVRYDRRFTSIFQPDMTFLLTSPEGKATSLSVEITPISELNISPIISRETSFLFSCTPAELTENEMIILLFNDANNRAASITIEGPADLSQLQLSGDELGQLDRGAGSVYAVKKKDGQQKYDDIIAHWSIEYYSDERLIQIQ